MWINSIPLVINSFILQNYICKLVDFFINSIRLNALATRIPSFSSVIDSVFEDFIHVLTHCNQF